MAYYATSSSAYTYLWSKYRPAILKLMVDSLKGPQKYKFMDHEFKSINAKEKGGYAFELEYFNGKPINNLKSSAVAKDLLIILQQSAKAMELSTTSTYKFTLDKQLMLHVEQLEAPNEEEELNVKSVEPSDKSNESDEGSNTATES